MMALDAVGKLHECPTFIPQDLAALAESADFSDINARNTYEDLIVAYRDSKSDQAVPEALLRARQKFYRRSLLHKIKRLVTPGEIRTGVVKLLKSCRPGALRPS